MSVALRTAAVIIFERFKVGFGILAVGIAGTGQESTVTAATNNHLPSAFVAGDVTLNDGRLFRRQIITELIKHLRQSAVELFPEG